MIQSKLVNQVLMIAMIQSKLVSEVLMIAMIQHKYVNQVFDDSYGTTKDYEPGVDDRYDRK
jgi:hypothetical protein